MGKISDGRTQLLTWPSVQSRFTLWPSPCGTVVPFGMAVSGGYPTQKSVSMTRFRRRSSEILAEVTIIGNTPMLVVGVNSIGYIPFRYMYVHTVPAPGLPKPW